MWFPDSVRSSISAFPPTRDASGESASKNAFDREGPIPHLPTRRASGGRSAETLDHTWPRNHKLSIPPISFHRRRPFHPVSPEGRREYPFPAVHPFEAPLTKQLGSAAGRRAFLLVPFLWQDKEKGLGAARRVDTKPLLIWPLNFILILKLDFDFCF